MKKISLIIVLMFLAIVKTFGQGPLGCATPTLNVLDANTFTSISSVISCTADVFAVSVYPNYYSGNNSVAPCLRIQVNPTNANSATNNSVTLHEGTVQVAAACSTCAISVGNASNWTYYVTGLDPTSSHFYRLCNINAAANMTYSVFSCYTSAVISTGTWNNATAGSCQTVTIPANTPIGTGSFAISPTIAPTAYFDDNSGNVFIDPAQLAAGTYSVTYNFNGGACTSTRTRTFTITNPYTATWTTPTVQCTAFPCLNLNPQVTGTPSGTFVGTGVSSNSFCPGIAGAGTYPVTYTVGITPTCGTSITNTITVNTTPVASAGSTKTLNCIQTTTVLNGSGGTSYSWSGPGIVSGGSTSTPTVNAPGTYTLTVTTASCISSPVTVSVNQNTTQPAATAGTTGSITCSTNTINLSSNPTSMNYTWTAPGGSSISSGTNSQNAVGQGSGTYTVLVLDPNNGCSRTATVAANVNTVQPAASAATTGSITCTTTTINLSSNPASMNYTWTAPGGSSISSGTNSQNAVGQGSGTYTVTVRDPLNGCSRTATVAANVNTVAPSPTASSSGTVTCASTAINLSSTPAGLTYSWTAPAGSSITSGSTSQNATATGAGTYTVLVTNPTNGCARTATVAANTNTTLSVPSISPTPTITCTNTIVTLIGNPTSGVLYSWTGSGVVGASNQQTVTVNQSGTYSLVVTSTANSCTASISASVSNNTIAPTITPVATQTITCASPSVTLIGSANPSSCTVVWTGGVCGGANSYTATACAPGTYTYIATNPANGCPSAAQVATVVPNSSIPSATVANTGTITCATTTVQVVSTTTASPVTYSWTGPGIVSGSNTPTITVSAGGTYSLVLLNTSNSCSVVITNSVTANNAAVTPTTTASNTITCNTTTVNLTTNAGAGSYTYNWSGPAVVGSNTLSTATASLGGLYTVTVTNTSNGCVGTGTVSVSSNTATPTGVSINPPTFTLSCATPTTVLTATASGATTYTWIAPAGGSIISGTNSASAGISGAGTYSVIVAGSNGCPSAATEATIVPNTNAPTFTLSNSSPSITCLTANPTVSVAITSTVPIISYSWTPSSGIAGTTNTSVVTFTAAGTYTGVITANNGCISNAIVSVTDATVAPAIVAGTGTAQAISCANPSVIIAPTFTPSAGLTYTWTGPGVVGSANDASVTVNQNGTYSLSVTNTLTGCTSTSITIPVVGTSIPPTLNVTSTSSVGIGCLPTNTIVTLTANATPSTGVTYNWSTSATTETISVTSAGVYSVVVTDLSTSCTVAVTYTVENSASSPTISAGANAVLPCGTSGTTLTLNGTSTPSNVTYVWSGPGIVSGSNTATPVIDQPGIYTLSVTNPTTGCSSTSTVSVINGVPTASFTADVTQGINPLTVNFTNQSIGALTYTWSFGNGNTSNAVSPQQLFNVWGTYTVSLIAASGSCSDTASIVIIVDEGFNIEIPNVFTPNGDGTNDVFTIKSTGVKEISLEIFNRWGQKMYEFTGAKASWDGMMGNGEEASAGTYFYFIKAKGFDVKEFEKQGAVSLFR